MKRIFAVFLQIIVVLVGIGALVVLLWEPHLEGRNVGATLFQIYFNDPFLAYAYTASIPFFVALFQAFKALTCVKQQKACSSETASALRTIRYCAMALVGFAILGEVFIISNTSDDRAGGVFMGMLVIIGSFIIAGVAAMLERMVRNASTISSE